MHLEGSREDVRFELIPIDEYNGTEWCWKQNKWMWWNDPVIKTGYGHVLVTQKFGERDEYERY